MRTALAALLLIVGSAWAQPKLTLTIDHSIITLREGVNLTITLTGTTGTDEVPRPEIEKLQLVGGPYTSTSYEFVNGKASSSVSWTYRLRAVKTGSEEIGPLEVKVDGKPVVSNKIIVNVTNAGSSATTGTSGSSSKEAPDVFIRVVPDKTQVFQGEQVTLTYKIYFAAQITQPEVVKSPTAAGFWVEEMDVPQQQVLTDEMVNGRAYKVGVLRKLAVFPTSPGDLTVEPMTITTKVQRDVRRRSRDPFDIFNDPFFSLGPQLEPMQVESPPITIKSLALPVDGVPSGFSGAVGEYRIRCSLDRPSAKTDEAVTLVVEISGTGNIKTLPQPDIAFPLDLEHYDPKSTVQIQHNQREVRGTKRFEYVVIPRAAGRQIIPAIDYAYFDPVKREYSTVSTVPMPLAVEKNNESNSGAGIPVAAKRGVESIATDIAYIKTRPDGFLRQGRVPTGSVYFWLWTSGPWVILGGILAGLRNRERSSNVRRIMSRSLKSAKSNFTLAERHLKSGDLNATSRCLSIGLGDLITASLGHVAPADLSDPELMDRWAEKGLEGQLLENMLDIEHACEVVRFAPTLADPSEMGALVGQARSALQAVERQKAKVTAS